MNRHLKSGDLLLDPRKEDSGWRVLSAEPVDGHIKLFNRAEHTERYWSVEDIHSKVQKGEWRHQRDGDVMCYFGTPLFEAGMSIQQLAKATGWKWESIAHWIEDGLLQSEAILLRGQPCRVVMPEHLLAFRRQYLPLADLAHAMDTRPSYLVEHLRGIELLGAKPLPNGQRRGGLLRISDLGRLAVQGCARFPYASHG